MGNYIPGTKQEQKEMLAEIGFGSMEELFGHIPDEVKVKGGLKIPEGMSELEVRKKVTQMAEKNKVFPVIFRGAGAYRHFIPSVVKSVISKENLLTEYTPYQAEISQGILQSIFEYQTMICELTGMDTSNASVYDGASAAAEGIAMCRERKRKKEKTIDDRKKRSRQEIEKELERKTNKKEQYEVYIMERQRSKSLCDERI